MEEGVGMGIDWQLIPVFLIILTAAAYLALLIKRSWKASKSGCGGGCGCARKTNREVANKNRPSLISSEQLTLRLRQREKS